MTTVAVPTTSATLPTVERAPSPRPFSLPSMSSIAAATASDPPPSRQSRSSLGSPRSNGERSSPAEKARSTSKPSPHAPPPPAIKVKKEPGSPSIPSARPRPKRLDLSSSTPGRSGLQTARPSAPLTSRDSAGLAIQDVGLACLSPGFQTNDPSMREQLQRSLDVRDQQRQIIEARQRGAKPGSSQDIEPGFRGQDGPSLGAARQPMTAKRRGPPAGLSISAPSASQFAEDRVIQSAPLHQTFTGLRPGDHPYTRHAQHGPSNLGQTSHIHHVPASQTDNRLPSISDVFAHERLHAHNSPPSQARAQQPVPSPGFPPPSFGAGASVPPVREFRSADEAVVSLSGGREELMPKHVHYGGVQPPTPPSPMPPGSLYAAHPSAHHPETGPGTQASLGRSDHFAPPPSRQEILARTSSTNGRRRDRDEFERDNGASSPASTYRYPPPPRAKRPARDGVPEFELAMKPQWAQPREGSGHAEAGREREDDWRRSMSGSEKKAEFLSLCERAWDLFHS